MFFLISALYMKSPRCSSHEQTVSTFQCLNGKDGSGQDWSDRREPPLDLKQQASSQYVTCRVHLDQWFLTFFVPWTLKVSKGTTSGPPYPCKRVQWFTFMIFVDPLDQVRATIFVRRQHCALICAKFKAKNLDFAGRMLPPPVLDPLHGPLEGPWTPS